MKVIIIGGGACGASTAARLRRLDDKAEILILEKTNEISIANCGLPYYCSDVINSEEKMHVSSIQKFKNLLNVDIILGSNVTEINREKKYVTVNGKDTYYYDKLVLTPGASPIVPPIPGIKDNSKVHTVRMLNDAERIKSIVKTGNIKNAVVIGGGFIGVEMAENLAEINGIKTTLIEAQNQILPPIDTDIAAFAHNEMRKHGVDLILSDGVKSVEEETLTLMSGKEIPYDLIVMAVGVRPQVELAKMCGITTGSRGGIVVNEKMQTNDKDIFAGGDSVEVTDFVSGEKTLIPLAGPANRQGRIIADNIAGFESTYKKTMGSAVVKVFDFTIASVGNNEKQLIASKTPYLKTFIYSFSHASYYPNATRTIYKLLFGHDGKILGAQAAGREMVEKRIDVIATAMRNNETVTDLIDSELCYAPPYSSAKDAVNILGMHADNILKGLVKPAFLSDMNDCILVDVRSEAEYTNETINGAININTPQLRTRYNELPKDKKVILFCNTGFQSYVASRILSQLGFNNVYSLAGGIELYKELKKDAEFSQIKVMA